MRVPGYKKQRGLIGTTKIGVINPFSIKTRNKTRFFLKPLPSINSEEQAAANDSFARLNPIRSTTIIGTENRNKPVMLRNKVV
jgi:hypothetical protein